MTQAAVGSRRRGPRAKRAPRKRAGPKFDVRVTEDEMARLKLLAGDGGVSAYVRAELFSGPIRRQDELRKIAALHILGHRISRLADNPAADPDIIATTLGDVCAAIIRLADEVPEIDDEDGPLS